MEAVIGKIRLRFVAGFNPVLRHLTNWLVVGNDAVRRNLDFSLTIEVRLAYGADSACLASSRVPEPPSAQVRGAAYFTTPALVWVGVGHGLALIKDVLLGASEVGMVLVQADNGKMRASRCVALQRNLGIGLALEDTWVLPFFDG